MSRSYLDVIQEAKDENLWFLENNYEWVNIDDIKRKFLQGSVYFISPLLRFIDFPDSSQSVASVYKILGIQRLIRDPKYGIFFLDTRQGLTGEDFDDIIAMTDELDDIPANDIPNL